MDDTDTKPATTSKSTITTHDASNLSDAELAKRAQDELDIEDDVVEVRFQNFDWMKLVSEVRNFPVSLVPSWQFSSNGGNSKPLRYLLFSQSVIPEYLLFLLRMITNIYWRILLYLDPTT